MPNDQTKTTDAERRVIEALTRTAWRSSHQLAEITGLGVPSLYAALAALEERGLIRARWEEMPQPRRRRYDLTERENG